MDTRLEQPVTQMIEKASALVSEDNAEYNPNIALWLYTQAESVARLSLGEDHCLRLNALFCMGLLYAQFGEFLVARRLCAEVLERIDDADPNYGYCLYHLGLIDERLGESVMAEHLLAQAVDSLAGDDPLRPAAEAAAQRLAQASCKECGAEGEEESLRLVRTLH